MWTRSLGLLQTILLLWPLQAHAANFTFSYGQATQCDDFQVSWTGGTPPFQLTIIPSFGTPRTSVIPDSSFSNNQGSFSTTMNLPKKQEIVAVMSDSTGFGSGGVTRVITVGAQVGKTSCNITDPGVDFFYETNSALAQCRTYTFSGYDTAVQPVQITGVVPGGSTFILNPPKGAQSFDWIADVAARTELVFFMVDANNRAGGSTEFTTVGLSDDQTCLLKDSPASVSKPPVMTATSTRAAATKTSGQTATGTATSTATSTSSPDSTDPTKTSNAGTVAAAIVGTIVALLVVGTLIWFYLRRRNGGAGLFNGGIFGRRFRKQSLDLTKGDSRLPPHQALNPYPLYPHNIGDAATPNSTANLLTGRPSADGASTLNFAHFPNSTTTAQFPPSTRPDSMHDPSLYGTQSGYGHSGYGTASQYGAAAGAAGYGATRPEGSVTSWDQSVTSSAARRKAAQAGVSTYQPPARFILHTDIEDDIPPPPEDEVIELPPQYTERRAPPPAHSGSSQTGQHSPSSPTGLPYADTRSPFS
ncbi:hypothetical protein L226DRAFT_518465 [Lentinus tigrinus ALCF2SS1-7]|uniref:Mid2 domain-containing protein n=1 Tax=Lentinus tigrinus ALCF2SS1-6 TaxID=1328759 RepID=A0A5C2RXP2_9APHY|nr:hypothetical protein L227DRAFT_588317 [Lentinus tigrinus ALCF2SS1-6]RPD82455.1 hypothetical protein L226DRAFT_518465 [Lentinus tigrinus ALCF2SS1-7]